MNLIKDMYTKATTNITHGERLNVFFLRLGKRRRCSLSQLQYNIVLEIIDIVIKQEKEITGIQIGKKKLKLPLFRCDMIVYVENPS